MFFDIVQIIQHRTTAWNRLSWKCESAQICYGYPVLGPDAALGRSLLHTSHVHVYEIYIWSLSDYSPLSIRLCVPILRGEGGCRIELQIGSDLRTKAELLIWELAYVSYISIKLRKKINTIWYYCKKEKKRTGCLSLRNYAQRKWKAISEVAFRLEDAHQSGNRTIFCSVLGKIFLPYTCQSLVESVTVHPSAVPCKVGPNTEPQ